MKSKILHAGLTALLAASVWGCVKNDAEETEGGRIGLESFTTAGYGMVTRDYDGIDENDPTMSVLPARLMAGQLMRATIDGTSAEYGFDGAKWVPVSDKLFFPGYNRSSLELRLSYPGEAVQDGSKTGLMIADVLQYENDSQMPARSIEGIELLHRDALVEVELVDGLTADEGTGVRIDDDKTAYNIPQSTVYQCIVEAGAESFTIGLTHDGRRLSLDVPKESSSTDGEFRGNCRYRIKVRISDTDHELRIAAMSVTRWNETGEASGGRMFNMPLEFAGKGGSKVQVNLASGMEHIVTLDQNGRGTFPGVGGDLMESIAVSIGEKILIGRRVGAEPLKLSFGADNSLQLTEEDGYITVNSFAELAMLDSDAETMRKNVRLTSDLDLMGIEWDPIGEFIFEGSPENVEFSGTFDGQGHGIYNLNITSRYKNSALFAVNKGTVQNVKVMSGTVSADGDRGFSYAAGIVAQNYGTIMQCENHAEIRGTNYVGGIVAQTSGNVVKCGNYGAVTASGGSVGGVAGNVFPSAGQVNLVLNVNYGEVKGAIATGGIAGLAINTIVAQCENHGTVTGEATTEGDASQIGGIAGILNSGQMEVCTNNGKISGTSSVGGVTGYNSGGMMNKCTNNGEVEGSGTCTGGITGQNAYPVYYCTNTGKVTGDALVGGITGQLQAPIENCYSTGEVYGNEGVGGIAGSGRGAWVKFSFNYGKVAGIGNEPLAVGGVVGSSADATVMGCANRGDVSSTGNYVGGVTGLCTVTMHGCYNQGSVTSTGTNVGGIAGSSMKNGGKRGLIRSCYNTGEVTGTDAGSLAGNTDEGTALLECYYKDGTPIGTNNISVAADLSYTQFGVGGWPEDDNTKGWGVGAAENPEAGYWWSSLGDPAVPVYPVLRDEPAL